MGTRRATSDGTAQAPLLVSVAEAARMLWICKTSVYHLIWSGQLNPIHIGRSVRFTVAELERCVADRTSDSR